MIRHVVNLLLLIYALKMQPIARKYPRLEPILRWPFLLK